MRHFRWSRLAVMTILAWPVAIDRAFGQAPEGLPSGELAKVRQEVTDLRLTLMKAEAIAAELEEEARLIAAAPKESGNADLRPLSAKDDTLWTQTVKTTYGRSGQSGPPTILEKLAAVAEEASKKEQVAVEAWRAAIERRTRLEDSVAEAEKMVGRSRETQDREAIFTLPLIATGTFSILLGLALAGHEGRDRLRWRLRALGSRPSVVAAALIATIFTVGGASALAADEPEKQPIAANKSQEPRPGTSELTRLRDDLLERVAANEQSNASALQRLSERLAEVRRERATYTLNPDSPAQKSLADQARATESEVQDRFRAIRISGRVAMRAIGEAEQIEQELATNAKRLQNFVSTGRRDSMLRLAACGGFVVATVAPLVLIRRRRKRELDEASRKCPRCLKKDTFSADDQAEVDSNDDRLPKSRLVDCKACRYELRENYIRQNRLCFPTVGIRSSGKTHWLVMLYRQIKNSNVQVESKIKKIPSQEDARFDEMVESVLYNMGRPSATVFGLPYPLTFHVNDRDPLGASQTMVNLFDYAGDLTTFRIDGETEQNEFRRRALLCEGFTLFLDPTQITRDAVSTIEDQIKALAEFIEEMHAMRGIPMEKPIDLPIAVCISKIDLLVNKNPMGTQAVPMVAQLRETMGRTPRLSLIHERSRLIARALPQMFPGWSVERELRENFGGRYMFFPMSAVGLEENELGIDDFSSRLLAPFGVLEPLLWLLHMHGYCVFH